MKNPIVYLQEILKAQRAQNPQLTQKLLAENIGLSPSYLSDILSGKRCLTYPVAERLEAWFASQGITIENFLTSVEVHRMAHFSKGTWEAALDRFLLENDMWCGIVLELTRTADYQPSRSWILQRLKLSPEKFDEISARLVRLELLNLDLSPKRSAVLSTVEAKQKSKPLQQQAIEYSKRCIYEVPVEDRQVSGVVFACNLKKMRAARHLISEFTKRISKMSSHVQGDEVYTFSYQLFSLEDSLHKPKSTKQSHH